jgi:hypothetical protein
MRGYYPIPTLVFINLKEPKAEIYSANYNLPMSLDPSFYISSKETAFQIVQIVSSERQPRFPWL